MIKKIFYLKADKMAQKKIRDLVELHLATSLNKEHISNIQIAVIEAVQNIVKHGLKYAENREILVELTYQDFIVEFNLFDDAPPSNPSFFMDHDRSPNENGGMGLNIIKKLTKTFKIYPLKNGNRTQLVFNCDNV